MNFFKKSFAIVFASVLSLCTCFATPPDYEGPEYVFKVVFLGDSGVGKTCVMNRIVDDVFLKGNNPTIGVDYHIVTHDLGNGKYACLQMWDTAGQERFSDLVGTYLRGMHCVLLVFDVTSKKSFENICQYWYKFAKNNVDQDLSQIAISVVGNKIDLSGREVSFEEGLNLANLLNAGYFEVSAENGMGIEETLRGTVDETVKKYNNRPPVVEPVRLEGTAKKAGCC